MEDIKYLTKEEYRCFGVKIGFSDKSCLYTGIQFYTFFSQTSFMINYLSIPKINISM